MNTLPALSPLTAHSEKELLSFLLERAQEKQSPVAVWRLPDTGLTHLIIADDCRRLDPAVLLEELEPGFIVAAFDKTTDRYFLPAHQHFTFENGVLRTDDDFPERASQLKEAISAGISEQSFTVRKVTPPSIPHQNKASFLDIVKAGIREIAQGTFEKIVPSRTRTIILPDDFDLVKSFLALCRAYPDALVSFVDIPGAGSWLGASPEVLVSVHEKSIFKTVALAGTQPYRPGVDIRSVSWTQKEIEEQALVERYVISCFKKIRLREYEEYGPKTVVAGNLMHLKSEFTVDMKATNFPQIGSVMLDLLHPTSAVCGMPLETAFNFLKEHETYHRGFYAGYLGPVNINNNIDLFVNLRCMQLAGNTGILYAGAGVTADSVPEKEWEETEMKFNTLLNVIL